MNRKNKILLSVTVAMVIELLFFADAQSQMTDSQWLNKAEAQILLDNYKMALDNALANVDNPDLRYHYLAGICNENLGNWDEAINQFQAAIDLKAKNERSMLELSYIGLGRALMGSGRYQEAIDAFRIVVQKYYTNVDPKYPRYPNYTDDNKNEIRIIADDAQFAIGECYEKLGDTKNELNAFAMLGRFYPFSRKTTSANEKVSALINLQ